MERAIQQTARILGLAEDWLNAEASILLERGLPEGILERSAPHAKSYGPCLIVQFIDRRDQVALKLFAAMDPVKGRRHENDLVEIKPSKEEVEHATQWLLSWPSNGAFKKRLAFLVNALGFEEVSPPWDETSQKKTKD